MLLLVLCAPHLLIVLISLLIHLSLRVNSWITIISCGGIIILDEWLVVVLLMLVLSITLLLIVTNMNLLLILQWCTCTMLQSGMIIVNTLHLLYLVFFIVLLIINSLCLIVILLRMSLVFQSLTVDEVNLLVLMLELRCHYVELRLNTNIA